jgi:hypothetical protein
MKPSESAPMVFATSVPAVRPERQAPTFWLRPSARSLISKKELVMEDGQGDGRAQVEPVLKVESREELVYLLGQACEIEHALMCEYLYAQFSALSQSGHRDTRPSRTTLTFRRWSSG